MNAALCDLPISLDGGLRIAVHNLAQALVHMAPAAKDGEARIQARLATENDLARFMGIELSNSQALGRTSVDRVTGKLASILGDTMKVARRLRNRA